MKYARRYVVKIFSLYKFGVMRLDIQNKSIHDELNLNGITIFKKNKCTRVKRVTNVPTLRLIFNTTL